VGTASAARLVRPAVRALAPALAAAALASAVAAPATAATLSVDRACYSSGESVLVTGGGFTPGGRVTLTLGGQQLGAVTAGSDGALAARLRAPRAFWVQRLALVATDRAGGWATVGATIRVTDTDAWISPAPSLHSPRRIRARGFVGADRLYAHVKRRGSERARNIPLGRPRGACGLVDVRRRLFPRHIRPGAYTIQVDAARLFFPLMIPSVRYFAALR
jgi:hypothetical protein